MGRHAAAPTRRVVGVKGDSKAEHGTSAVADLQLVLHSRRLLIACVLALVVPFGIYFGVIVGVGKLVDWALFLFAPMIVAGVAVGAVLDRAYARTSREV
jgi:hypothetical protein